MAGKRVSYNFTSFVGQSADSPAWKGKQSFQQFRGFDVSGDGELGGPVARTTPGCELLNFVPINQNPDGGSVGAWANTMSVMAYKFPDVKGNVFACVLNGDGSNGSHTLSVGRQGRVLNIYQELWEGPPVQVVSRDTTVPPEPPEPDGWTLVGGD